MTHIVAMIKRMIPAVASRGRVITMLLVGLFGIAIMVLLRTSDVSENDMAQFVALFGFTIFVPLVALVISTATLGSLIEDETLIYFWLRPFGRWKIAAAAIIAGLAVLVPLILVPMAILGGLAGGSALTGALAGSVVGLLGYLFVFTALGAFTQRALAWGLLYVLVWEGLIAGFSRTAGRLAIRSYANSAMMRVTDVNIAPDPSTTSTIIIVTVLVGVVSAAVMTWRLNAMTVD